MKVVNLDPDFNCSTGESIKSFTFPSGCEVHTKLDSPAGVLGWEDSNVVITTRVRSSDDIFKLLLVTDTLRANKVKSISLFLPYLPYARQDRRTSYDEPFSLKVLSDIINLQGYKKVYVYDPHSDVSTALINNCEPILNHTFVARILEKERDYLIVAPDAGACKKINGVCDYIGYKDEIILCNKVRDTSTGRITSMNVYANDLGGRDCYIIDDICDGGMTFAMAAEALKNANAGKVNLIVSHGIFSKGVESLHNIDHIYTTNSFRNLENSEKVTQCKLKL